jgi:hypothetical protein
MQLKEDRESYLNHYHHAGYICEHVKVKLTRKQSLHKYKTREGQQENT